MVIDLALCKRLRFYHATNWYMYKLESVLSNETCKILRDLGIQMDHRIPAKRLDQKLIKKKRTCQVDFDVQANHKVKIKESENIDKFIDLAIKNLWMVILIVVGALRTFP